MKSRAEQPSGESLLINDLFEVLAHNRRRILLAVLQGHDQPQAVADVVKEIAAYEQDAPVDTLPPEDINQIHYHLHHVHIPKLEEYEFISYNDDRNTIALTERATHLQPYIERIAEAGHADAQ